MRFIYSDHAKRRMRERKILRSVVRAVVETPEHVFTDTLTGYAIYIKRLPFKGERRLIAVSIDQEKITPVVVSVHPIRERDFISRTESRRWI